MSMIFLKKLTGIYYCPDFCFSYRWKIIPEIISISPAIVFHIIISFSIKLMKTIDINGERKTILAVLAVDSEHSRAFSQMRNVRLISKMPI